MPRADSGHGSVAADQRVPPRGTSNAEGTSSRNSANASNSNAAAHATANDPAMSVILCTGGYDNTIRFWEAWSGICSRTIQHPESQVNRLAISPDKRFIAAAGNQMIKLYDMHQQPQPGGNVAPYASLEGHGGNVTALAWQNDGRWLVSASEDGTLKIWDVRASHAPQRNFDHKSPVNDCVIHPNQGELVSCDQAGAIKIWDLGGRSCTHELMPEDDVPMRSVTVGSDTKTLVAGNNKGFVYVWSMQHGREITDLQPRTKFQAHQKYLLRALLSPNMKLLATSSADRTIKLWNVDPNGYTPNKTLTGHQRWVWDMAFSADSAYLVSASSDHYARLWELQNGQTVKQYAGHSKPCCCVALNDSPS